MFVLVELAMAGIFHCVLILDDLISSFIRSYNMFIEHLPTQGTLYTKKHKTLSSKSSQICTGDRRANNYYMV